MITASNITGITPSQFTALYNSSLPKNSFPPSLSLSLKIGKAFFPRSDLIFALLGRPCQKGVSCVLLRIPASVLFVSHQGNPPAIFVSPCLSTNSFPFFFSPLCLGIFPFCPLLRALSLDLSRSRFFFR